MALVTIRMAGIDPALSNFGLAKATYDVETGIILPEEIKLLHTEKRTGKTTRQNSDDMRRAQELSIGLHEWVADCTVVFAEIPTGSQSARGAFSNGASLGILSSIGVTPGYQGRLIQVLPHEVKMAATGSKHAAKQEMIEWGVENYPTLPWRKHRGKVTADNEHLADALATIAAGVLTDEFINLRQMIKLFRGNSAELILTNGVVSH